MWIALVGLLACSVPLAAALPDREVPSQPVPQAPVNMVIPREPVLVITMFTGARACRTARPMAGA